jgi:hypothetical protein
MLGLADSDNYCHAAAFTSDNEIVVLEVVFGQFNLIERSLINKEFVKFMTVCEDADVGGGVRNG